LTSVSAFITLKSKKMEELVWLGETKS